MRALTYTAENTLTYGEAAAPQAAADEVLLKILYCGICGSDRHAYHGKDARRVPPLILGHEAVGEDDSGAQYIINPLMVCGVCTHCHSGRDNLCPQRELIGMKRPGAFADYVAMPRRNLLPLPPALPPQDAALAEPAACAWRLINLAARHWGAPLPQARALVIGAGGIGILSALALSIGGCRHLRIVDTQPARCAVAEGIGVPALDVDAATATAGEYDIVADAVGAASTRQLACALAAPGGVVAHIGLEAGEGGLDARRMTLQEIAFVGSYTYTASEFAATVQLLADGAFGEVSEWTDIRPLADGAAAFAALDAGDPCPKIILQP